MPLSLDLSIETPENVVLTHQLAGPAARSVAYLIDFFIRAGLFVAAFFVLLLLAVATPGVAIGTLFVVLFALEWGYTIGFEYAWSGVTPGKHICGLRVMHENGQPLSWWGATLRNLLRVADVLPMILLYEADAGLLMLMPLYGPGLIAMILSPKLQRLGDLAARTVVVHVRRSVLPRDPVIYERIAPLGADEIRSMRLRSETLTLIDQFLGRRSVLTYARGHELAQGLALNLAERLDYRGDRQHVADYPMAFLARVYVTFALDTAARPVQRVQPTEAPVFVAAEAIS